MYILNFTQPAIRALIPEFVKALILEIEHCQVETQDLEIETIFIGGGTLNLLKASILT